MEKRKAPRKGQVPLVLEIAADVIAEALVQALGLEGALRVVAAQLREKAARIEASHQNGSEEAGRAGDARGRSPRRGTKSAGVRDPQGNEEGEVK